jgi:hypothetical protein
MNRGCIGRLGACLLSMARRNLRKTHGEWAEAMAAEAEACTTDVGRLRWAWGCWVASLRVGLAGCVPYPLALAVGAGVLALYEWNADEGGETVLVLGLIAVGLGLLRPRHAVLSGLSVGLVVAAVIAFEALSGVQPAYEVHHQTLGSCLHWTILVLPSLAAAVLGGGLGKRLDRGAFRD